MYHPSDLPPAQGRKRNNTKRKKIRIKIHASIVQTWAKPQRKL